MTLKRQYINLINLIICQKKKSGMQSRSVNLLDRQHKVKEMACAARNCDEYKSTMNGLNSG